MQLCLVFSLDTGRPRVWSSDSEPFTQVQLGGKIWKFSSVELLRVLYLQYTTESYETCTTINNFEYFCSRNNSIGLHLDNFYLKLGETVYFKQRLIVIYF